MPMYFFQSYLGCTVLGKKDKCKERVDEDFIKMKFAKYGKRVVQNRCVWRGFW